MLALIALVTFALLARAFRSVALALKAVILNVISLGASYGFLVLFWQQGHGSKLIYGVPATGAIRDWVPIVMFAFLFGLSMDYEVFVLARIREEYDRTADTGRAVVTALARTGRLVTCAALILAISFVSLSTQPDIVVRLISTGLAFGIILDAVVVPTLLVPALVALLGRWNWWMPNALARILRVLPGPPMEQPSLTLREKRRLAGSVRIVRLSGAPAKQSDVPLRCTTRKFGASALGGGPPLLVGGGCVFREPPVPETLSVSASPGRLSCPRTKLRPPAANDSNEGRPRVRALVADRAMKTAGWRRLSLSTSLHSVRITRRRA